MNVVKEKGACGQESYNQIQEVLQQPEASEFLNAATMVATEDGEGPERLRCPCGLRVLSCY